MATLYSPNTASQCPLSRLAGTGSTPMLISSPFYEYVYRVLKSIIYQFICLMKMTIWDLTVCEEMRNEVYCLNKVINMLQ